MLTKQNEPNKLFNEKSPYLFQHAYNPVLWLPWGDDAFGKAKAEDKPIFLSIGYSTCHWCHVMAEESFEDSSVAEILNSYFIPVKVDREERPDVDNLYMAVCQMVTGAGGWPLSLCLFPDGKPFFAGTYFPKENFKNLLLRIYKNWQTKRSELSDYAKRISYLLEKQNTSSRADTILNDIVKHARKYLELSFTEVYGGFSRAPKFPTPHNLLFLLNDYRLTGNKKSLSMCEKTLTSMREGGIYDHAGGGFSRYSTDNQWLIPHFEKMLYDNALLILAYTECFAITNNLFYAETVKETAGYLLRDMRGKEKAFFNAEDADTGGIEGLFYTFSFKEIEQILGKDAKEFSSYYNITPQGNFEGRNILNTIGTGVLENRKYFSRQCLDKLFDYRQGRSLLHKDKKLTVSNNGLTMAALSNAGKIFNNSSYIQAAIETEEFISKNLTDKNGRLLSYYLNGAAKQGGFADDYAFFIWGLLSLYESTNSKAYLQKAINFQDIFTEDFFDKDKGGFYISGKDSEKLIIRAKEIYDGAVPSSNSVTLHNVLKLYELTNDNKYLFLLAKTLNFFKGDISAHPANYVHGCTALQKLTEILPSVKVCKNNVCFPIPTNIEEFIEFFK